MFTSVKIDETWNLSIACIRWTYDELQHLKGDITGQMLENLPYQNKLVMCQVMSSLDIFSWYMFCKLQSKGLVVILITHM